MKNMLRKLLVICLVLMLTCSSAMACSADNAQAKLNKTLYAMVDAANLAVKAQVKIAQATPYNDVEWLLVSTQATVAPVYAYAKLIGATVVCEYDYYNVDGQVVAIDPLKVINVRETLGIDED